MRPLENPPNFFAIWGALLLLISSYGGLFHHVGDPFCPYVGGGLFGLAATTNFFAGAHVPYCKRCTCILKLNMSNHSSHVAYNRSLKWYNMCLPSFKYIFVALQNPFSILQLCKIMKKILKSNQIRQKYNKIRLSKKSYKLHTITITFKLT